MPAATPSATRSARLGLRATPEQEAVLRRAAEVAHKSLTDFILDSACQAAQQTLLDQRLFMVSGVQYQAFMDLLEQPEQTNESLRDLLSRKAPWDAAMTLRGPEPLGPQHLVEGFDCGKTGGSTTGWCATPDRRKAVARPRRFVVGEDDRWWAISA